MHIVSGGLCVVVGRNGLVIGGGGGVFSPKTVVTISIIKRYRPCAVPGYATPSALTPPSGLPIITPPALLTRDYDNYSRRCSLLLRP